MTSEQTAEKWFALYVRSNFERKTEEHLKGRGYHAFSPFYKIRRKRAESTKRFDVPLFPGYVFASFNPCQRLPILTTPGVVKIVGSGNVPEPLRLTEIESIQKAVTSGCPVQPWPYLKAGQRVRIEAGPLAGTEGLLIRVKDERRLVVSITLLQRAMALELDQEIVQPVFETAKPQM
jgi:transcription antitermination factor NusG